MDALTLLHNEQGLTVALVVVVASFLVWNFLKPVTPKKLVTLQGTSEEHGVALPLIEKEELSHDTRRFRFGLSSSKHILGLPIGQHVSLRYIDTDGKEVVRSYTPVSSDDAIGYVDLIVKVYFKNVHPKFPDGGKMSQHLNDMKLGETIIFTGPKGKLTYVGKGECHIKQRVSDPSPEIRFAKQIGMIAGGTGITPMLQIIRRALSDNETTEFHLLFANQTEQDILCREEIESMAAKHPNVHFWYTIDRDPSPEWKFNVGFVNAELIKKHLPAPGAYTQIFMCGPPPMLKFAIIPALEELGYTPNMYFSF